MKVMLYFASPTTMLHYVQLYNLYYDTKSSDTALFLVVNTPSREVHNSEIISHIGKRNFITGWS